MASPPSLDEEIASLQEELATLRKSIKIECSTILSSAAFQSRRSKSSKHPSSSASLSSSATQHHHPNSSERSKSQVPPSSTSSSSSSSPPSRRPPASQNPNIASATALQAAHIQQSTYRIASSITAFRVRDPDPNAVDGARVLGLRFEVMARGHFLAPYYVMLNRPYAGSGSGYLRVHRHTVPPAVPLAGLAGRYLPPPGAQHDGGDDHDGSNGNKNRDNNTDESGSSDGPRKQDLGMFARKLRRELVRYHNRLGAAADLRHSLSAHNTNKDDDDNDSDSDSDSDSENETVDVGIADIQAKQIRLAWPDSDRNGRIVLDDDGALVKAVVLGPQGRDWETERQLFGDCEHVHDVIGILDAEDAEDAE